MWAGQNFLVNVAQAQLDARLYGPDGGYRGEGVLGGPAVERGMSALGAMLDARTEPRRRTPVTRRASRPAGVALVAACPGRVWRGAAGGAPPPACMRWRAD